jgi:hypothetical protein
MIHCHSRVFHSPCTNVRLIYCKLHLDDTNPPIVFPSTWDWHHIWTGWRLSSLRKTATICSTQLIWQTCTALSLGLAMNLVPQNRARVGCGTVGGANQTSGQGVRLEEVWVNKLLIQESVRRTVFLWYDKNHIENYALTSSSSAACIRCRGNVVPCLLQGKTGTKTNGRDLRSTPLKSTLAAWPRSTKLVQAPTVNWGSMT